MSSKKKQWLHIFAYGMVFLLVTYQCYALYRANRMIEAYEMNSSSAYKYVLSFTDFELFAQEIENLCETEELNYENYRNALNLLDSTKLHLMQLNSLRGYSTNRENFSDNMQFTFESSEGLYVFKYVYMEQYEFHNLINNVWMALFTLLREIQERGINEDHRKILALLPQSIREVDERLKFIREEVYDGSSDLQSITKQFQRVYEPLERAEDILSPYLP